CALTVIVEHLAEYSGAATNRWGVLAFARGREARVVHRATGGEHRAEPARIRAGLSCPAQRRLVTHNRVERGVPAPVEHVPPGSPGDLDERGVSGILEQPALADALLDADRAENPHRALAGLPRRAQPGRSAEGWRSAELVAAVFLVELDSQLGRPAAVRDDQRDDLTEPARRGLVQPVGVQRQPEGGQLQKHLRAQAKLGSAVPLSRIDGLRGRHLLRLAALVVAEKGAGLALELGL